MARLAGKKAVVLGATGKDNMGQVIARRMASEGASVLVAGRREEALPELASEIGGHYAGCDITKKADVEALADAAASKLGGCDVAVNATGWGLLSPILETSEAELDDMVALQFKGVYFFLQAFGKRMSEGGGGSIIQITSATSYCPIDNHAAYIGTKAGGDRLVMCFANELGGHGVKVNSLAPGLTATPMVEGAIQTPGLEAAFAARYPLGRIGSSDDIADAAVWLAEDTSFITGQVLQINGGLTLRGNPTQADVGASVAAAMAAAGS
ncbi:MAG: SDR family oxidoreductase [Pseudomonadota bacterium]